MPSYATQEELREKGRKWRFRVAIFVVFLLLGLSFFAADSIMASFRVSRIDTAISQIQKAAHWASSSRGGVLKPSRVNQLDNLVTRGFAPSNPWKVDDSVEVRQVTWDQYNKDVRIGIEFNIADPLQALEVYQRYADKMLDVEYVGGHAYLECLPPEGSRVVMCLNAY